MTSYFNHFGIILLHTKDYSGLAALELSQTSENRPWGIRLTPDTVQGKGSCIVCRVCSV